MIATSVATPASIASAVGSNPMPQESATGDNPHDNDSMATPDEAVIQFGTSAEAVRLAQLGWSVFPVTPREKRPATSHGFKDASCDVATVEDMFGPNSAYNIGIATGIVSGDLIVIDADMKPELGKDGISFVEAWQREHGTWPDTVEATSGGGGHHWYFKAPPGIKSSANAEHGVDVRAEGGYIVAPPSIHPSGTPYEWVAGASPFERDVAQANDSVLDLTSSLSSKQKTVSKWSEKKVVPEGTRDDELFRACSSWQARGYGDEEIMRLALEYNERAFQPPLSVAEVETKVMHVTSAYAKGNASTAKGRIIQRLGSGGIGKLPLNDSALSGLFAHAYIDQLRYEPISKSFYKYNGRFWEIDRGGLHAELLCKQFIDILWGLHKDEEDETADGHRSEQLRRYKERPARERILKDSRSELRVDASLFDANLHLLNVANGTIDLETGEIRPHDPIDLLTMCAHVEHDSDATCETWDGVLGRALGDDQELVQYFYRALGVALLTDDMNAVFHVVGFAPRSGKSLTFGTLLSLLGTGASGYACVLPGGMFERRNKVDSSSSREDLMMMRGKKLALVNESSQGMVLDAALVKQITGGDMMSARANYGSFETFMPHCKIFIVTNHMPQITDRSIFDSNRLSLLPFDNAVSPSEEDTSLAFRLRQPEELSGILNRLLAGVRDYRERGLSRPPAVERAIEDVKYRTDSVRLFLKEATTASGKPAHSFASFHDAYVRWCGKRGLQSLDKESFKMGLAERGISIGKRGGTMRDPVEGVALKEKWM